MSTSTKSRYLRSRVGLVLCCVLAAGLGYKLYAKPAKPADAAAIPVNAGPVTRRDMPVMLSAVGTVSALNAVDVKVRVDGQLQKLNFTEGQEVRAGALLAQLDPKPFMALLHQAEASKLKDQALLDNLKLDVARYGKLAALGAGTTQNLDTSKAQLAAQQAAVAADNAQIETSALQLGYTTIKAPISGRLGLRQTDVGSMVHASDATGIVTVTQMQPITVLFSVPQDVLGAVVGAQDNAALPVDVASQNADRVLAQGKLVFIDSQVDQTNGQIRLKASFDNEKRTLWPGQLVTTRLLLRTEHNTLAVPSRAVQVGQNGPYVYVMKADRKVTVRPVGIGVVADGFTQIKTGLTDGEQVVFDGQSRISEGALTSVAGKGL